MTTPVIIDFQAGGIRDVAQAFRTIEQSVVQLERRLSRSTTETERLQRKSAKETERAAIASAKARERAEREQTKGVERLIKEQAQVASDYHKKRERDERNLLQIQLNSARMATAAHKRELAEREQADRRAMRAREQMARNITGSVGRAFSRTAMVVGGASALIGGFSSMDMLQREAKYRGSLADLANSGYMPGDAKNGKLQSSKDLDASIKGTAIRYGYQKDDAAAGLQKFVAKTGDLKMGLASLEKMAELARATGSSLEDMADAAGDAFNSDKNMSAEQLMIIMGGLAGQGKQGAVEMRDLASQMAKLQAAASNFSGDRQANLVKMGVLTQIARARGGAASADEAATSTQRFATDLMGMSSKKKGGLNFTNADGTLKDPLEIINMINKKTGGNASTINDMFGERGVRVMSGFADIFRTAESKKAGSGQAAVEEEYNKLQKSALTQAQIKEAADKRMAETDMKLEQAMVRLRESVATHLLPVLERIMPKLEGLIPLFGDFMSNLAKLVEFMASHPWLAGGLAIGGQVAAGGLRSAMGTAVGSMAAAPMASAGAAGLVSMVGAAAIGAAIGAAAGAAIVEYVYGKMNESDSRSATLVGGSDGGSLADIRRIREGGTVTEEQEKAAKDRVTAIEKEIEEAKGNWFTKAISGVNSVGARVIGDGDVVENKKRIDAEKMKDLNDSLEKAKAAVEAFAGAVREAKPQSADDPNKNNSQGGAGREFVSGEH
jgi:hypothetical protein